MPRIISHAKQNLRKIKTLHVNSNYHIWNLVTARHFIQLHCRTSSQKTIYISTAINYTLSLCPSFTKTDFASLSPVSHFMKVICADLFQSYEEEKLRFCRVMKWEQAIEQYSSDWLVRVCAVHFRPKFSTSDLSQN